jgi:hypothetical protein
MNQLKKVLLINLLILLAYTALSGISSMGSRDHNGLGAMILMALAVALHFGILFIISIVKFARKDKQGGQAYLLASFLILLIGFSACYGVGALLSR